MCRRWDACRGQGRLAAAPARGGPVRAGWRAAVLAALAGRVVAGCGVPRRCAAAGMGVEAALVVAFEAELLLGVLGAGLPGVGESLDRVDLGGAGGGLGVAFAGGVGADVVVFGAGVGFGLPGAGGLGAGVVAGLGGGGQRGVPLGEGGVARSARPAAMAASACRRVWVIWSSA